VVVREIILPRGLAQPRYVQNALDGGVFALRAKLGASIRPAA